MREIRYLNVRNSAGPNEAVMRSAETAVPTTRRTLRPLLALLFAALSRPAAAQCTNDCPGNPSYASDGD